MLIGEKKRLTRLGLACGGLQPPVTYSACIPSTCPKLLKRSIILYRVIRDYPPSMSDDDCGEQLQFLIFVPSCCQYFLCYRQTTHEHPPTMTPTDIPTFASTQLALLSQELAAGLSETASLTSHSSPAALQRAGLAILNLHILSQRTGLGGKTVLALELDPAVRQAGGELPEHGIRVGDIVRVSEQHAGAAKKKEKAEMEKSGVEGVVVKTVARNVAVALKGDEVDVPGEKLWM